MFFFLLRQVHGHDALGDADLDSGKPDARRRVHGVEHILDQCADSRIDAIDRRGNEPQPFVGKFYDFSHRHDRDVSGANTAVNARGLLRWTGESHYGVLALFHCRRAGTAPSGANHVKTNA